MLSQINFTLKVIFSNTLMFMNINKHHKLERHKEELYEGSVFGYFWVSSNISENKVRLPDVKD